MSSSSSDEGRGSKKNKEEQKSQDSSSYGEMDESEEELTEEQRIQKEEEEIKKHQLNMAKRFAQQLDQNEAKAGKRQAQDASQIQSSFRSSKGLLTLKNQESQDQLSKASFQNKKQVKFSEECPFSKCGRKFDSLDQLKSHLERRHKPPKEAEEAKSQQNNPEKQQEQQPLKKVNQQIKKEEPKKKELEIIKETPIHQKQKIPKNSETGFHSFNAQPQARPITSWVRGGQATGRPNLVQQEPSSRDQQELLNEIMKGKAKQNVSRPYTAATTSIKDEHRIMNKLRILEKIEQKIEDDLEEFIQRRGDREKAKQKGIAITKSMLLEQSQCDKLSEINILMLREKNIEVFDRPPHGSKEFFLLEELSNLECLFASHNLIKDIYGISQISNLRELNLSFNLISDITPIEELVSLEKLHLNRNKVSFIEPLLKLVSLKCLGLFHNEIINSQKSLEIFAHLAMNFQLTELSIEGNPITSTSKFRNQILVSIPQIEILDDEKIQQLDRDVANQYFEISNIEKPVFEKAKQQPKQQEQIQQKKKVKFQDIDNDNEDDWQTQEIKKLEQKVHELVLENIDLKRKLQKNNYDQVYKENQILNMQLKNMIILQDENKDLREDLDRLKRLSYDDKIKEMHEENKNLRKRNGFLLIQNDELQQKIKDLSENNNDQMIQSKIIQSIKKGENMNKRPQTAAQVLVRKKEELNILEDDELFLNAQSELDNELNQLLAKNQKYLNELHSDMKEVSKIVGEPVVKIRKINNIDVNKQRMNSQINTEASDLQIDSSSSQLIISRQNL